MRVDWPYSSYDPIRMRVWRSRRSQARALVDAALADAAREEAAPRAARPVEVPVPVPVVEEVEAAAAVETPAPAGIELQMQTEFLRLLEVVTSMCDHVIEYIETDRAERQLMLETLRELGRVITDGATAAVGAAAAAPSRQRVIGGSMPAGPDPVIDLSPPVDLCPPVDIELRETREIAVEVRGRFGDRWVDGFEICEVMTTPDGPRYRLRRHRDGVVLPELFDATSIRHVETFDQLSADQLSADQPSADQLKADEPNGNAAAATESTRYWSRS